APRSAFSNRLTGVAGAASIRRVNDVARTYRTILGNRSLRRVVAAYLLFNVEESAIWLGVVIFAYLQGGTATAGIVAIAQLVPAAAIAPFAAVMGDRMRRDRALALGYAAQTLSGAALAVALWLAPPLVAYAAAVISACTITLTRPVHNAILPELSDTPEELTAANSLSSTAEGIGVMLGPILTGVCVAVSGTGAAVAAGAGTAALAAVLAARARIHHLAPRATLDAGGLVAATVDGFRGLRSEPGATTLTLLGGAQQFVAGVLDVLYAAIAVELLVLRADASGPLASSLGIGGLVGAAATVLLVGRRRLAPAIQIGLVMMGAGLAAISLTSGLPAAAGLIAVVGAGRAFFDVAARTLLPRTVPNAVIARVFGLQEALTMAALAAGSAVAPIVTALLGLRGAFVVCGALLPVAGLAAFRTLRGLDARAVVPDAERLRLLGAIPIFTPLPTWELEQVAGQLGEVRFDHGAVLIREGDVGDRFYVVTSGEVAVSVGGREVAQVGPGGYVGEIALLQDVPRTATVRALGTVDTLALDRDPFLQAVTGALAPEAVLEVERRLSELRAPPHNRNKLI
ncbi:MAG: cyclic nucleotide-binding domain-containing protein, partial [Actinomycetota bacterium]